MKIFKMFLGGKMKLVLFETINGSGASRVSHAGSANPKSGDANLLFDQLFS